MNNWHPVTEYQVEYGRVVVWLRWSQYSDLSRRLESEGEFQLAYRMQAGDGAVWVEAKDCIPIETANRRVTHFMRPHAPTASEKQT